jgi:SAM-dependent methyltransferase
MLRRVYEGYFELVRGRCTPGRPVVELGAGPGFLKAYWPEIIATDVVPTPWADRVVDATALPFEAGEVGNLVMFDVFHHLAAPPAFLEEAARVLAPGGRVVMLEPWTSALGYLFYRHIHHEDADRGVDPAYPFPPGKNPMDGNAALPQLYFAGNGAMLPSTLRLRERRLLPGADWLLTGGFQDVTPLPASLWPLAAAIESALRPFARWVALRALIVLEKPNERDRLN